ncbi:uncharacterized protein LOC131946798 [Physella acuta]|uniref:uncharacterized protein LOC131946798 n=1 Tax=Physella acuta TaxID=109671 RepID=UPI0027DD603A|nr:uncharacterized protein LOC131946798 [Physella acuta]XP_059163722.1 uncharacterized protein LOC131946798 [Physella acuta]XP_059163723.1 uncharacterized protein LOC131946798 [Physella acuta]XP_059163724.1 uncharacterized protein LOC131946798 [Physella acuta]
MAFVTAHHRQNMTGIYLGLGVNTQASRSKSAIPPLARGRGISYKVRTPAEDHRYKMVENLRMKEEKRGFSGSLVRNCKSATLPRKNQQENKVSLKRRWGPGKLFDPGNVDALIRPNSRCFTTVANSGVTRSEKLISSSPHKWSSPTTDLTHQFNQMFIKADELAGLKECYRRICNGSEESLYRLLPDPRTPGTPESPSSPRHGDVGFTVRSYMNPHKAEILADFPHVTSSSLPKLDPRQRPFVIDPRHPPWHQAPTPRPGQFDDPPSSLVIQRSVAAPGTGGVTKTLPHHTSTHKVDTEKRYMSNPLNNVRTADEISESAESPAPHKNPLVVLPHREAGSEEEEEERGDIQEETRDSDSMTQVFIAGDVLSDNLDVRPRPRLTTSNSGADIMLGLETDDGKSAEVEIDSLETDELQPEDIPKGRVRKTSIVEKLSKSKESELIALSIMESAGQRQREFEKLISEHQELVQEISRTPSAENIVQSETGRDP